MYKEMENQRKIKLNLSALKQNQTIRKEKNNTSKTSIVSNTQKKQWTNNNIENKISISIQKESEKNKNSTNQIKKNSNTNQKIKEKEPLDTKEKNQENQKKEIFSSYTSDFEEKKDEALKESKKIKILKPKKIVLLASSSFLIIILITWLIVFKFDSPITNKIKASILNLKTKQNTSNNENTKNTNKKNWDRKTNNILGTEIKYQISSNWNYKIDWKIFENKDEFENYLKIKTEKLKIEKLKEYLKNKKN